MTQQNIPAVYPPLPSRRELDRQRYQAAMAALGNTEETQAKPAKPDTYWNRFNSDPAVKRLKRALNDFAHDPHRPHLRAALLAEMDAFELRFRLHKIL